MLYAIFGVVILVLVVAIGYLMHTIRLLEHYINYAIDKINSINKEQKEVNYRHEEKIGEIIKNIKHSY